MNCVGRQREGAFAVSDEDPGIEPCRFRSGVRIGVLAKEVLLTSSRVFQLLNQASAKERPKGCPVSGCWNADWVPLHEALVELVHATGDNGPVEKMGKAGEPFGRSGLDEEWFLDADAVIKVRWANDAFAEGSDLDEKVSALATSRKSDVDTTRVIGVQAWPDIAGFIRFPPQKFCMRRARPKPILESLRG
jgi:hypothetical protein